MKDENIEAVLIIHRVLALLHAQYLHYQTAHWTSKGSPAYGNHLMFQRIYEGIVPQIDTLAEKMVPLHPQAVGAVRIAEDAVTWLVSWSAIECIYERSLQAESDFQSVVKEAYDGLKEMDALSLGMDDFLMGIASEHETNQYLVGQVLNSQKTASAWSSWTFSQR